MISHEKYYVTTKKTANLTLENALKLINIRNKLEKYNYAISNIPLSLKNHLKIDILWISKKIANLTLEGILKLIKHGK